VNTQFDELDTMIKQGNFIAIQNVVKKLLEQGEPVKDIIHKGIVPSLHEVGRKFSTGEVFIPEMLVAAKASKKALEILKPILIEGDYESKGKVVIGTVKGDLHDVGKKIVAMVFESLGFKVKDLGIDVSPEKFVDTIKYFEPEIVALSCLLTTTMENMRLTIDYIKEANLRDSVKIIIGGPPTNEKFAREIGADFYGEDAYTGVTALMSVMPK